MPATYKVIIALTGTLSTLVALGLVHVGRHAEHRHLLRKGLRVEGVVVAIDRSGKSTKSARVLRYRFAPHGQARMVEGRCEVNAFSPYKPGDTAIVCYNRSHPASSIILSPKGTPL